MDRDQRSRQQKSGTTPRQAAPSRPRKPKKKSMRSRMGLTKEAPPAKTPARPPRLPNSAAHPAGQPQAGGAGRQPSARPAPRQTPPRQQNPQKANYRPGRPARPPRRITRAEQLRQRRRRAVVGGFCVLVVLVIGIAVSISLLFKVTDFRVETPERTTPADTGIYTEQEIIDLLGVAVGDNLFSINTKQKTADLAAQLPYLDTVEVNLQMPGTVVIKVAPATERFAAEYAGQWLVLTESLKVLRTSDAQPDGLILLEADFPDGQPTNPGAVLTPALPDAAATDETAQSEARDTLAELMTLLDQYGLLDGVTSLSITDMDELNFLYEGRISVRLGTANNLEYKIRLSANELLDLDGKGMTSSDRGTLDVSYQRTSGEIYGYFQPAEPDPTPTPEPTADATGTGDTGEAGGDAAEPTATPSPTE